MTGNVGEWCSDWYGDYSSGRQNNPQGASSGKYHVIRGGSLENGEHDCRVANRCDERPNLGSSDTGFRLVLVP